MISIMAHDWTVTLTTEPIGGDTGSRAFLGMGNEGMNQIFIDGTMPQTRQEEVFLHEITHQATHGMPEFAVNDVGIGLYAVFKQNGLIPDDFLSRFVDGTATQDETRRLNEESKAILDQPDVFMMRVSEKHWDGEAFTEGALSVTEPDGSVNRTAVHKAAAALAANMTIVNGQRRIAKELSKLYQDVLKEPVPRRIKELSK